MGPLFALAALIMAPSLVVRHECGWLRPAVPGSGHRVGSSPPATFAHGAACVHARLRRHHPRRPAHARRAVRMVEDLAGTAETTRLTLRESTEGEDDVETMDAVSPPAQTTYRGWVVLALCCAIAAVCSLDRVVMSIAILPMGDEFAYSASTKGLVAASFSAGYCTGLLPAGLAATVRSPKTVLTAGLLIWSAAQAATPFAAATSLPTLLTCRAVMGIGEAACVPSLQVVARLWVPEVHRSSFWGVLSACFSLGTIGAFTLTPPLMDRYGWPAAFTLFGFIGVAIAGVWATCALDAPESPLDCAPAACDVVPQRSSDLFVATAAAFADAPWRRMAASPPVWALAASHMSCNFFNYFAGSWLPTYFANEYSLSVGGASGAAFVPFAVGAVASATAGAVADRLVAKGWTLTRTRKVMQLIAGLGPAASCTALVVAGGSSAHGGHMPLATAQMLFVGAISSSSFLAAGYGCCTQDISKRFASLIYGTTSALAVVVGASAQFLTGALLDRTGGDFAPLLTCAALVEVAGVLAFTAWWDSTPFFD